jgi:hypothetical protein
VRGRDKLTSKEKRGPQQVERELGVVELKSLVGLSTMNRQRWPGKPAEEAYLPLGVTAESNARTVKCEAYPMSP